MSVGKCFTSLLLVVVALLLVNGSQAQQAGTERGPRGDRPPEGPRGDGIEGRLPPPPDQEGGQFNGPRPPREGFRGGPPPQRQGEGRRPFDDGAGRGPGPGGPGGPGLGPSRSGPHGPPHPHFTREHEQRRLEDLKEVDPELYELEKSDMDLDRQTHQLGEQLRRAPKTKQADLRKQLNDLVQKHFDVRQARRELHLVRLAEELDKLRASMEKRKAARDQIISRRVSELVGEEDDMAF